MLSNSLLLAPFGTPGGADTDAMDTHTGYTETSGTISASAEYSSTYAAWKAADGSVAATSNTWLTPNGTTSGWLKYQFSTSQLSGGYSIQAYSTITQAPKDWTFEGSNNGTDWDVLDTQTGETGWSSLEKRTYTFTNYTAYEYYRLNITDVNGGAFIRIGEFEILV